MSCLECSKELQCGECCKQLIFISDRLAKEQIHYYKAHGCEINGNNLIVPIRCPHLTRDNICDFWGTEEYPKMCRDFVGQEKGYFMPDVCVYKNDYKDTKEAYKEIHKGLKHK